MPRTAIVRTMFAATIGLGALLAAAPATAAPATAVGSAAFPAAVALDNNCCQVSLTGVPGQLSVGGPAAGFTATFTNSGQQPISTLQVVFTFTGNQLAGNQIDLERRNANGNWQRLGLGRRNGQVTAVDSRFRFGQPLGAGQNVTLPYRLAFTRNAHPGQVGMGLAVFGRMMGNGHGGGDNQQLASAPPQQINVVSGAPTAKPTPTPTRAATPTPTPTDTTIPTPTDTTQVVPVPSGPALTGLSDNGGGTSSFMWIAYTVGGLLLLAGIGVIGTMLWKRGPQIVETEWQEPTDPYDTGEVGTTYGGTVYGAPTQAYPRPGGLDSTRQMPGA
jgi:hypothetical protein